MARRQIDLDPRPSLSASAARRDAVRWQELQSGEAAVLPDSAQAPRVVEIRSPESRARLRDLGETLENSRGVNAVHAAATLLAERRKAARFR
jgi:hypothetical protein